MSLDAAGSNPVSGARYAVRSVLLMSAAATGNATSSTAAVHAARRTRGFTRARCCAGTSFRGRLAPLEVDVVVHPRMRIEGVVFVALYPGMHYDVLEAIGVQVPGGVGGHQRRHAAEELHPLRSVGQALRLVVERVEFGKVESRKIRHAFVGSVQQIEKAAALVVRRSVRQAPHLQLSRQAHFQGIGKLLLE